jgi:hypothetical protein
VDACGPVDSGITCFREVEERSVDGTLSVSFVGSVVIISILDTDVVDV